MVIDLRLVLKLNLDLVKIVQSVIENRLLLGLLRLPVAGSVVAKQRVALWRMRLVGL
jgi:hypothetical protein